MLSNLLDEWFHFPVGEGAFYAAFGFLFVFAGIVLLILIFTLLGFVMSKINAKRASKAKQAVISAPQSEQTELAESDGISDETVAVIAAALTAYYAGQKTKCDFVVKRIKRL